LRIDLIAADAGVQALGVAAGVSGSSQAAVTEASRMKALMPGSVRSGAEGLSAAVAGRMELQRLDLLQLAGDLLIGDHGLAAHRQHAHHFLAVARDAHFLALLDQFDQGGETGLGFVDADGLHGGCKNLAELESDQILAF
jgi:hypothetical protein